jgi:hypothetical protein
MPAGAIAALAEDGLRDTPPVVPAVVPHPPVMPVWRVAQRIGCGSRQVLDLLDHMFGDYPNAYALVDGHLAETLIALGRPDGQATTP